MWQLKVLKPNHLPLVLHQFYAPISIALFFNIVAEI